jgi:hypothetical protein
MQAFRNELAPFKNLLPYSFSDLSSGFRYLGYFLKTGAYRAEDWDWLVAKNNKEDRLMVQRWLTLGGRYILVKTVLEGQYVYWMSMESIPHSVLNKIRKLMFQFLWNGHKDTQQFHLCRWDYSLDQKRMVVGALETLYCSIRH